MCNAVETEPGVSENLGTREPENHVPLFCESVSLAFVSRGVCWEGVPVIAVAEECDASVGQVKIRNRHPAKRNLRLEPPPAFLKRGTEGTLDVCVPRSLLGFYPNSTTNVRARDGVQSRCALAERFAAHAACGRGHVRSPVGRCGAASGRVAARPRAKPVGHRWIRHRERVATMLAKTVRGFRILRHRSAGSGEGSTMVGREGASDETRANLRQVFTRFGVMLAAMSRALPGHLRCAGWEGARMRRARHYLSINSHVLISRGALCRS